MLAAPPYPKQPLPTLSAIEEGEAEEGGSAGREGKSVERSQKGRISFLSSTGNKGARIE